MPSPFGYLSTHDALLVTVASGAWPYALVDPADSLFKQRTLARAFRGELVPTDAELARRADRPTPEAAASGPGMGEAQSTLDL